MHVHVHVISTCTCTGHLHHNTSLVIITDKSVGKPQIHDYNNKTIHDLMLLNGDIHTYMNMIMLYIHM